MKRYRFHQPIAGQCSISIPSENVAKPGLFDVLEGIEIEQWLEMCESLTSPVTKLWRTMLKNLSYVMSLCNGIRCMWCCFVIWYHLYNFKKWEKHPWRSCTFRACNFSKGNTPPRMFFTFLKLNKCYQIAQRISSKPLKDVMTFDAFENGLKQFTEAPSQATKMKYSGKMVLL